MQLLTSTYISSASGCGSYFTLSQRTQPSICTYQNDTVDTESNSKYGVLYNFCAASGGKVCIDSPSTPSSAITNNKINGSIYPSHWTMPQMNGSPSASGAYTYGFNIYIQTSYSMANLFNAYGINNASNEYLKVIASPLNFPRAGFAYNGSLNNRGSYGQYWSSTPYTDSGFYGYLLDFRSSSVSRESSYWYVGHSVRCVLSASS